MIPSAAIFGILSLLGFACFVIVGRSDTSGSSWLIQKDKLSRISNDVSTEQPVVASSEANE
ncbi:MAG TPA: hypothetical protein ACN46X_03990 [Prochlorococcus sp.]|nr:hypothetical protein [Prochlorococcaceae cyanobacterium ETNP18_MAG_14]